MPHKQYKVLGLMSGSSLDGLDIAYCSFEVDARNKANPILKWDLLEAATLPFSEKWEARLAHLPQSSALDFAKTHTYFGRYSGELVNQFLEKHGDLRPDFIASHGHTIFHNPDKLFTSQIGDGAALSVVTQYPVICDFRTADIALSGEGAPLAPIADKYLFQNYDFYMNIGGIANITCNANGKYIAFDIGPANQVFNILAQQLQLNYDDKGAKAASGRVNKTLLNIVNKIDYFGKDYPKSMDNQWLVQNVVPHYIEAEGTWEDKLCTACEQLAIQTANAINRIIEKEQFHKSIYKLLPTGGGTFNDYLMSRIQHHCENVEIMIPKKEIIDFKEAILIALLGVLRMEDLPNALSTVTGAKRDSVGGAIYKS